MAMAQPEPLRVLLLASLRRIYPEFSDDALIIAALAELAYQSSRADPRDHLAPEVPMILIEVKNSNGVVGRCDAKCYHARDKKCDCCCGGANHGVGLTQALANMTAIIAENVPQLWIQAQGEKLPPGCEAFAQLPLWVEARSAKAIADIARVLQRRRRPPPTAPDSPPPASS